MGASVSTVGCLKPPKKNTLLLSLCSLLFGLGAAKDDVAKSKDPFSPHLSLGNAPADTKEQTAAKSICH